MACTGRFVTKVSSTFVLDTGFGRVALGCFVAHRFRNYVPHPKAGYGKNVFFAPINNPMIYVR